MKKIIITGATSMLGVALTEVAVREGAEVYAIVRPDTKRNDRIISSPLVHTVYGSLDNLKNIDSLPTDCDAFYHFAWAGTGKESRDDATLQERNIAYTLDAVELAAKAGCRRFVGAGSQAEYGPVDGIIDESTKYAPVLAYGIAKYAAGILSRKLCDKLNMEHVWGRIFSVYGPHDNVGTMLDYAIQCWKKGETAKFSAATHYWNYLYESDAGEMFYRMGKQEVPSGTWFVAHPESKVLREYINSMRDAYGEQAKVEFASTSASIPAGLNVKMAHTLSAIKYYPKIDFENGIRKMMDSRIQD